MVILGCKLRVLLWLIGVLNEVEELMCSIDVIRFLNLVPCELLKIGVWELVVKSPLVCFLGFTVCEK